MNNDTPKFDTIPQLEVILKSIDLDNISLLNQILDSKEIDNSEKNDIRKYIKLLEVSNNPSTQILETEIPR